MLSSATSEYKQLCHQDRSNRSYVNHEQSVGMWHPKLTQPGICMWQGCESEHQVQCTVDHWIDAVIPCLGCGEIGVEVVVVLPLLNLAGKQHLVVSSMEWHCSIRPVSASPHALLHMPGPNARLPCKQVLAVLNTD